MRAHVVGALEKVQERPPRIRRRPHRVEGKQELADAGVRTCSVGADRRRFDAFGLGISVGEERGARELGMARPEATADLLGVAAVALDRAGFRWRRDGAPREAAPHEAEAAPEEMDGRTLAGEPAA